MKSVLLFSVVLLFISSANAGSCNFTNFTPTTTLSGLSFCSIMNGFEIDELFAFVNPVTGESYPQFIDNILATLVWPKVMDYVDNVASTNGFTVCQSCMDNLQALLCAGAFPAAGYYNCLTSQIFSAMETACPALCPCNNNWCCSLGPSDDIACTQPANRNPSYNPYDTKAAQACGAALLKVDWISVFKQCNSMLVNKQACLDTVATCACILPDSAAAENACAYYSDLGFSVVMPAGDCSAAQGWCAQGKRDNANHFQINSHLTLNAPTPVASQAFSGSATGGIGGLSPNTNTGTYDSGIVPTPPAPAPSSAVTLASSVTLVAALLALVL